mmetsp:Transcript_74414/g.210551  ORF Transcript_74414/g.210551 Transcript_74414/m.210551 type:complete len:146 (+) Transcript_74414:81-518(+)|eukprot:CAMPEP_0168381476 /NCGR_PEP_ID=MMETSP0228-20121227/12898_1 /TAXON_ID=133427 /ORGANISM="Protoceratium reticulatum, Strain CCCM 535 (=CCMP 1889)" /LENGTH=145 /DNA_ID=CAMNT_0008394579 /DNA_START=80 /DNA_END=517 /DNA_ORIENTATION=+
MSLGGSATLAPGGHQAGPPEVVFADVQPTAQAASAAFIQQIRQTLQRAQEITQVVSEAENVADEATKFCEAIKAQHNIQPKKVALGSKPMMAVPPLAAGLTREIQTSVVWTQTMLQMCTIADGQADVQPGSRLRFARQGPEPGQA